MYVNDNDKGLTYKISKFADDMDMDIDDKDHKSKKHCSDVVKGGFTPGAKATLSTRCT